MSSELLEQIIQVLLPVLATILTAVFSYIGVKIKALYEEKVNTETKQKIVEATVKYVEQVFSDLHGKEKLQKAQKTATEWLNTKGIPISEAELTILIESAVKALNLESCFGELIEVEDKEVIE